MHFTQRPQRKIRKGREMAELQHLHVQYSNANGSMQKKLAAKTFLKSFHG